MRREDFKRYARDFSMGVFVGSILYFSKTLFLITSGVIIIAILVSTYSTRDMTNYGNDSKGNFNIKIVAKLFAVFQYSGGLAYLLIMTIQELI